MFSEFGFVEDSARLRPVSALASARPTRLSRRALLRRCRRSNMFYRASETACEKTILVAPCSKRCSLDDLASTLKLEGTARLQRPTNIDFENSFVGSVLAFSSSGRVSVTSASAVAELADANGPTGVLVLWAPEGATRLQREDLPTVRSAFEKVATGAEN